MLRHITTRFRSTCVETGRTIEKGELCFYDDAARKVYHIESPAASRAEAASLDAAAASLEEEETHFFINNY